MTLEEAIKFVGATAYQPRPEGNADACVDGRYRRDQTATTRLAVPGGSAGYLFGVEPFLALLAEEGHHVEVNSEFGSLLDTVLRTIGTDSFFWHNGLLHCGHCNGIIKNASKAGCTAQGVERVMSFMGDIVATGMKDHDIILDGAHTEQAVFEVVSEDVPTLSLHRTDGQSAAFVYTRTADGMLRRTAIANAFAQHSALRPLGLSGAELLPFYEKALDHQLGLTLHALAEGKPHFRVVEKNGTVARVEYVGLVP